MSGINKAIIVGRLGKDPEVKQIGQGQTVCTLAVATSENWMDKNGQKQERTEWHRIVVWGKLAEICGKYLAKGRLAYIEGRLQTRQWEDQQGQKKYTTEIVASNVQFLSGNTNAERSTSGDAGIGMGSNNNMGSSSGGGSDTKDYNYTNFEPEPQFHANDEIPF
jgi:single-strand DNA-binding protein